MGAQIIISGGITALGNSYRLRVRAISVETAEILGMQNVDVIQDNRIAALIGIAYTGTVGSSTTPSGRKSGTSPSATNTINPAETVVIFTGTGHRYEVINTTSRTWKDAQSECEKRGGYLATITSSEEQKFIEDLLSIHGERNNYWLGGYREGRNWKWVTGEPFIYSHWMQGEPNNSGGEDKLMMARVNPPSTSGRKGQWNDVTNAHNSFWGSYGYICEWD